MDDRPRSTATRSGTRPSAMTHLLHDRGVRFAAGLAIVVAIPVAVLFYFQFQSLGDLERTSAVVLRQLSGDTADGLAKTVEETLKRPHIGALLAVPQARSEPLDLAWIDPVLEEGLRESPFVEAFWVWSSVPSPMANRWLVFDHQSLHVPAGSAESRFREDAELGNALLAKFQQTVEYRRAIVAFSATIGGRRKYVQGQLRFSTPSRDRMSSLVALVVDAEALRTEFLPGLLRQRLAAIDGPTGFPPLQLRLLDDAGATLLGTESSTKRSSTSERSRSSSSTESCWNTAPRTKSAARSGSCRPATDRKPSRRS